MIRRLQNNLKQVDGIQLYMQPVQDITVDDRVSRTQYQYTLEDPDTDELNEWTNKFVAALKKLPELEDVATDQQNGGRAVSLMIDRVTASRLGIAPTTIDNTLYDSYGQREINTMYTQLNQYHVVLETAPQWQQNPDNLGDLYIQSGASSGASGAGATTSFSASASASAGSNALTSSVKYTAGSTAVTAPATVLAGTTSTQGTSSANGGTYRGHDAEYNLGFHRRECHSAQRIYEGFRYHRSAFHQSPGTVPVGDGVLQPGIELRRWAPPSQTSIRQRTSCISRPACRLVFRAPRPRSRIRSRTNFC